MHSANSAPGGSGGAPRRTSPVGDCCEPLAEILSTHPAVQQQSHRQATATFTKSHFGPTITETVVDYGRFEAAAEGIDKVKAARDQCGMSGHAMPY